MVPIRTVSVKILILGYKTGEKDSTAEVKQPEILNNNHNRDQNDNLTISDSELQYIVDNYDQFDQSNIIEQLLQVFRRNQLIFVCLLTIEMSLTVFLLFITWRKKENSIMMLQDIYKDLNAREAAILFYVVFLASLLLNVIFYPLGFYSLISKKVNLFKTFSSYSLYTAILTVFIIYINM